LEPVAPDAPISFNIESLEELSEELYEELLQAAIAESPLVRLVGLAEALKVRTISKGGPLTSRVLSPLQKKLWGLLQKHRTFALTGEVVTPEHIEKRLGRRLKAGELLLSGDYAAATDNLKSWVSECIADEIALVLELRDEERALLMRSLIGNVIETEILDGEGNGTGTWKSAPQTNGQLMGSVVSFPILCIANAALCRFSKEIATQRRMSIDHARLLVNGDDVCFKTTAIGAKVWEKVTAFAGLTSSVGKTFLSDQFVQINSTNFYMRTREVLPGGTAHREYFEETRYVNLGLMFGFKRSEGEEDGEEGELQERGTAIGVRATELVRLCPPDLVEPVFKAFLSYHREKLDPYRGRVPFYVPEHFGGLGLPVVYRPERPPPFAPQQEVLWGPSIEDRRIVTRIREDPVKWRITTIPKDVPWEIHQAVLNLLPVPLEMVVPPSENEEKMWKRLYASLCFSVSLSQITAHAGLARDLKNEGPMSKQLAKDAKKAAALGVSRAFEKNAKVWSKILRGGNLPPPTSLETMLDRNVLQPYLPCAVWSRFDLPPQFTEDFPTEENPFHNEDALWV
jgi:hypothetical protein